MKENVLLPQCQVDAPMKPIEPTLENVLVATERDTSLSESKREAWCCSIRRVAEFLEREPAQLPARLQALRFGIARLHHAQLGVSRKTLQNHLANLKASVRQFSSLERMSGRGVALDSVWQALHDKLTVPRLRLGLSSFLRYCSANGIEPLSVSDTTVEAFVRYVGEVQFTIKPRDTHKQVARCWNRARESVQDWPQIILTVPDFRPKPDSLPWDAFPHSLVEDVERHLALLSGDNILDEDAPDRACKPSTIATRRNYLRLAASAAVKRGVPAEELRSLADLVSPATVRLILEHYLAKKDGKIVTFTIDMAERLCAIARGYVKLPETEIQALERYCFKLRKKRHKGLTPKNMAVIRTFKNVDNRNRLRALPSRLFDEALAERDAPIKAAVMAQIALAIQILLVAPMRIANLAALNLEQHVVRVGGIEPTYHLIIPPEEVKNEEPLEYPLPKIVNEVLGMYLAMFRPRLCPTKSPWLFPGDSEGHKAKKTLSEQIIDCITEKIAIRVTPHQFRHLAAAFILEKDPANFEFVRRVLGHKNLQTTINFYVGLQTVDAVRKFSAMALEGVTWRPTP